MKPYTQFFKVQNETLKETNIGNHDNSKESLRLQNATSNRGKHSKYLPYAFTEHGVAMLASVLKSDKAALMNIAIVRAFIALKHYALTHKELTAKLKELEDKYNMQFKDVYEALNYLLKKDKQQIEQSERKRIGFKKE